MRLLTALHGNPALGDLSAPQFLFEYAKSLGPSLVKWLLARLAPSARVQKFRKAAVDIETESNVILAQKRAGLKAGDQDIVNGISEKKDVMSIMRKHHLPSGLVLSDE